MLTFECKRLEIGTEEVYYQTLRRKQILHASYVLWVPCSNKPKVKPKSLTLCFKSHTSLSACAQCQTHLSILLPRWKWLPSD